MVINCRKKGENFQECDRYEECETKLLDVTTPRDHNHGEKYFVMDDPDGFCLRDDEKTD